MNDFSSSILSWYSENQRDLPWRHTRDPYRIWVSEIMLQQTRVEAVKPYYDRFLAALPDLPALANVDPDVLYKLWQGLGYYSRARNMKRAAQICLEKYHGALPPSFDDLRALPGVGSYTAAAIASFAFGVPVPAVDGNVRRLVSRFLALDLPVGTPASDRVITDFLRSVIPNESPADFNQATIELGATVCGPDRSPRCGGCPLLTSCQAFARNLTDSLPVRLPKPARRVEQRTPLILLFNHSTALEKRPDRGLLSGLWQFPALEGFADEHSVRSFLLSHGCSVSSITPLPPASHVFTHITWEMRAFLVCLSSPGSFTFYSPEQRRSLAMPSAFKAYQAFW